MSRNVLGGLSYIESSNLSPLIITSDDGTGNSSVLRLEEELEVMLYFNDISHLEFGKRSHLQMIGTKDESTIIVDTNSGSEISKFSTRGLGNSYPSNRATFDYYDKLILSDGLIYDSRNNKNFVHQLDKFNSIMNAVFHPNGREIISNTEIWDMRTFKLLKTVPKLEHCRPTFNSTGTILYGVVCNEEIPEGTNSFYTFDAHDYSSITTFDVKRPIFQLSVDMVDRFVATIQSQFISTDPQGYYCVCGLYEIGRSEEDFDEENESEDTEDETEDDEEVDEA